MIGVAEEFERAARRCRSAQDLSALIEDCARELGFERFAMVHGLWFRRPGRPLIRIDNYGEFAEVFLASHFYRDDPATLVSQRSNAAFSWDELPSLIRLEKRHRRILDIAAHHGLRSGLTVPMNVPGEPLGSFSFVTAKASLPPRRNCYEAILVSSFAFREARRLHGFPARSADIPQISPRKHEILELAALGKTDTEIALILGLKRSSVETYMKQLKTAFDVYSRTQLCVTALRFGMIAFNDAISWI